MRNIITLLFVLCQTFTSSLSQAQETNRSYEDIIIKDPYKPKPRTTYFSLAGGSQLPFWTNVPMTPLESPEIRKKSEMEVETSGWFAGLSIIKKTKSRFEAGLDLSYYRSSVPVAYKGKPSVSDWVHQQNNYTSFSTLPFDKNISKLMEVYTIKALCRYNIPLNYFKTWAGISGGTYSSNIYYGTDESKDRYGTFPNVSLGLGFQVGAGILLKNKIGEEKIALNIFGDFNSPAIKEKFFNLFYSGWYYDNIEGSPTISTARIGLSIEFH
jgi:hypothetical protein